MTTLGSPLELDSAVEKSLKDVNNKGTILGKSFARGTIKEWYMDVWWNSLWFLLRAGFRGVQWCDCIGHQSNGACVPLCISISNPSPIPATLPFSGASPHLTHWGDPWAPPGGVGWRRQLVENLQWVHSPSLSPPRGPHTTQDVEKVVEVAT